MSNGSMVLSPSVRDSLHGNKPPGACGRHNGSPDLCTQDELSKLAGWGNGRCAAVTNDQL